MNRRGFFKTLLAAGAAAVAAPIAEELLELAGERLIMLPPRGGWPLDFSSYVYSQGLAEILRGSVQPLVRFREVIPNGVLGRFTWDVYSDFTTIERQIALP